eukprot:403346160
MHNNTVDIVDAANHMNDQQNKIVSDYDVKIQKLNEDRQFMINRFCQADNSFMQLKSRSTIDRSIRHQNKKYYEDKSNEELHNKITEQIKINLTERMKIKAKEMFEKNLKEGIGGYFKLQGSNWQEVLKNRTQEQQDNQFLGSFLAKINNRKNSKDSSKGIQISGFEQYRQEQMIKSFYNSNKSPKNKQNDSLEQKSNKNSSRRDNKIEPIFNLTLREKSVDSVEFQEIQSERQNELASLQSANNNLLQVPNEDQQQKQNQANNLKPLKKIHQRRRNFDRATQYSNLNLKYPEQLLKVYQKPNLKKIMEKINNFRLPQTREASIENQDKYNQQQTLPKLDFHHKRISASNFRGSTKLDGYLQKMSTDGPLLSSERAMLNQSTNPYTDGPQDISTIQLDPIHTRHTKNLSTQVNYKTLNLLSTSVIHSRKNSNVSPSKLMQNSIRNLVSACQDYQEPLKEKYVINHKIGNPNYQEYDMQLMEEKIRSDNLIRVTNDIQNLKGYRPGLLKTIHKETQLSFRQDCEFEKNISDEYINRKIDMKLQKFLDRKLKNQTRQHR